MIRAEGQRGTSLNSWNKSVPRSWKQQMWTVTSAPAAFRVRVWQVMSRAGGRGRGNRSRRGLVLTILGSPRLFSPRPPASRNVRFHASSSWAGTWLSRETASSPSPRSTRRTNSVLRCALQRSGSSDSSAARTGGSDNFPFGRFVPIVASMDARMISQTGVQGNRVRFRATQCDPGFGLVLDEAMIRRYRVASMERPAAGGAGRGRDAGRRRAD
jgi:hypothetical protein